MLAVESDIAWYKKDLVELFITTFKIRLSHSTVIEWKKYVDNIHSRLFPDVEISVWKLISLCDILEHATFGT